MRNATLKIAWMAMALVATGCGTPDTNPSDIVIPSFKNGPPDGRGGGGGRGGGETESWGNNLSVPVIFAEAKNLAGGNVTPGDASTTGLRPNNTQSALAAGITSLPWFWSGNAASLPGVYLQNTENTWMAEWAVGSGSPIDVLSYWGDNLTAQTWNINSVIRVEVNLKPRTPPVPAMRGFEMPYASGEQANEIKGTNGVMAVMDPYVYSDYACLKIEKLDGTNAGDVAFAGCVDDAVADGPGGYAAEVNVSGLVTYGYNWMLSQDRTRSPSEKAGKWRLTFSIKGPGKANIVAPADAGGPAGTPVVVPGNNATYLDITISSNQSKKPDNPGKGNKG